MKNMKQIFIVYSCDEWKTKPMSIEMVTTSSRKLKSFIAHMIYMEDAEYLPFDQIGHKRTAVQQEKLFKEDFDKLTRDEINSNLRYVFYDYAYDGERI